jgi:alpha,alpha-trehalose-phosphate synthase [UDP-forming]/trehalose-phosphatase
MSDVGSGDARPSAHAPTGLDLAKRLRGAQTLALLLDLDGTLIPHRPTPAEARPDPTLLLLLQRLSRTRGVDVTIVSGRPKHELESMLGFVGGLRLVAEHGVWRRENGEWNALHLDGGDLASVEAELRSIAALHPGALVERKLWSVCFHVRSIAPAEREAAVVEVTDAIERATRARSELELLEGAMTLEVRHRGAHKGTAVAYVRDQLGAGTVVMAVGDDVTDEDTFAALAPDDVAIAVAPTDRPSHAKLRLPDSAAVRSFLTWIADARAGRSADDVATGAVTDASHPVAPSAASGARSDLVVISNRLPDAMTAPGESDRTRNVGGLVSGLGPALRASGGLWLGWSGARRTGTGELAIDATSSPTRAAFDLAPEQHDLYYSGFSNRGLWPILHGFIARARWETREWRAYVEVNELFARHASAVATESATIWIHDYQLLLVGEALRRRGHRGPLGLFLHVPLPGLETLETIPWAREIITAMLAHDLVGFHTRRYAESFVRCAEALAGARPTERGVRVGDREVRVGAFPLGIDPFELGDPAEDDGSEHEMRELHAALRGRKLVLGVDRLDYTKGIPERIEALARLLYAEPSWRGRVTLVQVAVPSRADLPEYAQQRQAVETAVGRINGEHGEAHWAPVRYVHRSYGRGQLARLYRAAHVGMVTPLRDGMNLVAKEYVAAQDPEDPGVLLLSRFAGAAEELHSALLTNPYDRDGLAADLSRALSMSLAERVDRHRTLLAAVLRSPPEMWAASFLAALRGG